MTDQKFIDRVNQIMSDDNGTHFTNTDLKDISNGLTTALQIFKGGTTKETAQPIRISATAAKRWEELRDEIETILSHQTGTGWDALRASKTKVQG